MKAKGNKPTMRALREENARLRSELARLQGNDPLHQDMVRLTTQESFDIHCVTLKESKACFMEMCKTLREYHSDALAKDRICPDSAKILVKNALDEFFDDAETLIRTFWQMRYIGK